MFQQTFAFSHWSFLSPDTQCKLHTIYFVLVLKTTVREIETVMFYNLCVANVQTAFFLFCAAFKQFSNHLYFVFLPFSGLFLLDLKISEN